MKAYLNGKEYHGKAAYINGYNGYTSTEDNGLLCALIADSIGVPSCWDIEGKPNALKDENGNIIADKAKRGTIIDV